MVDPLLTSGASGIPFCDVLVELQVMCSDRVDPDDPYEDADAAIGVTSHAKPDTVKS